MAGRIIHFWKRILLARDCKKGAANDTQRCTIEQAWREYFAPVVRSAGFKGSGRHFRRVEGEFVQLVNLQGSQWGGAFAVNLGIQPIAYPDVLGRPVDVKTIKEIDCILRRRLSRYTDKWWSYTDQPESMMGAAKAAALMFSEVGLKLFDEQSGPAAPVFTLAAADFDSVGRSFSGFNIPIVQLAEIRRARGQVEEANAFAEIASGASR